MARRPRLDPVEVAAERSLWFVLACRPMTLMTPVLSAIQLRQEAGIFSQR